jgi:hypothetical protein
VGQDPDTARCLGQQPVGLRARLEQEHELRLPRLGAVLLDGPAGQDEHGIGDSRPEQDLELS